MLGGAGARNAVTDETGLALLTSFAGERSILSVAHRDHAPYRGEAFVPSSTANAELAVSLGQGGSVTVTMITAAGEPLAGGRVEHRAPGQDDFTMNLMHGASGANVTCSAAAISDSGK